MFLPTKLLIHASPIRRVRVHLTRHFRLSNAIILHHRVQVWWTIEYRTFYDRCCTQYFVENSRPTSAKIKTTYISGCKLWNKSKHVKINENLRICLNEALFSIKPGARFLFFILILLISWHFCDGKKLSVSCR